MCPICLTTVALLGSAMTSSGGLTAYAVKRLRARNRKTAADTAQKRTCVDSENQQPDAANERHSATAASC